MKISRYNYSTHLPDGTLLLFNFYTLTLIALSGGESKIAETLLRKPDTGLKKGEAAGLKKLLIDKGFILEDGIDELALLKVFHHAARFQRKNLGLTIIPTLGCNFSCIYCYESGKTRVMNREIEDSLLGVVKNRIQKGGSLSVTWFGGEPLLRMDIISRLSAEFIKLSERNDVKYSARIITNGYLLDEDNTAKLIQAKVKEAQVTLDGPKEVHDQRRPLKRGGATFDTILDNVKKASKKMFISLRMNIDHTNRGRIADLLNILSAAKMEKEVGFYLGHTSPYTDVCRDMAGSCLTNEDFSLLGLETMLEMTQRGFTFTFNMPRKKDQHCLAGNANSFVITPSGGIVNCWNDVDNPGKEIGHLMKPPTEMMKKIARQWNGRDPFEMECADCLLLPVCMGGCPYLHLRTGELACHSWRYHLKESLAFYYYLKKIKKEGEIIREFKGAVESAMALKEISRERDD